MSELAHIREIIISHDLDADFVKSTSVAIAWEYSQLYESLAGNSTLTNEYRHEEFAKRRGLCAVKAIARSAREHGIPSNFRRLECNGQNKLFVKAGRVVLIQEPMLTLDESPRASDYKRELADSHGLIRQLELDLGDQPYRIRDWSGCILTVLLHGASGPNFTREHKALGGLMLGVPNSAYNYWTMRLDLLRIAMFGFGEAPAEPPPKSDDDGSQTDNVRVTLKKKKSKKDGRE